MTRRRVRGEPRLREKIKIREEIKILLVCRECHCSVRSRDGAPEGKPFARIPSKSILVLCERCHREAMLRVPGTIVVKPQQDPPAQS